MKDHPIIFSGEMVRAILDGRKTQTRRVMKPQPEYKENSAVPGSYGTFFHCWNLDHPNVNVRDYIKHCPYGKPGDRLWVRETWKYRGQSWTVGSPTSTLTAEYVADGVRRKVKVPHERAHDLSPDQNRPKNFAQRYLSKYPEDFEDRELFANGDWLTDWWRKTRPSIHMPRWASRILLEVTDVKVERVREISVEDARAEGLGRCCRAEGHDEIVAFQGLWNSINEKRGFGWDENPWVWVVEFKRIKP